MNETTSGKLGWGISLGSGSWAAKSADVESGDEKESIDSKGKPVPSILLPRLPGEPFRLDVWNPTHPRGSGIAWPPESVVNGDVGSGRIPVSAAWTARSQGRFPRASATNELKWKWKIDDTTLHFDVAEGIAESIAQLCGTVSPNSPVAVVIPNDFKQKEQQLLIDLCKSRDCDVKLLWSPVAAALVWLERFGSRLEGFPSTRRTLLHVHLDWGATQFTELEIVSRDDPKFCKWLPARSRPKESDIIPGFGWTQHSSKDPILHQWQKHLSGSSNDDLRYKSGSSRSCLLVW